MNLKESHKRMVRAVELVIAALLGAMLSNMLQTPWISNDPFNLGAILRILLFLLVMMIIIFGLYCSIEFAHRWINRRFQ